MAPKVLGSICGPVPAVSLVVNRADYQCGSIGGGAGGDGDFHGGQGSLFR